MKYRECKQQLSFFIEGWQPGIVNSRLHPSFKLHGTVTGRLSCENPNLQQVPRDPFIRSLLCAPPGWVFVEADLSQIELRIAAELAKEANMLNAFQTGIDLHWATMIRSLTSDIGPNADLTIKTAEMYCVSIGLPANRASCEVLLDVFNANKKRTNTTSLIQLCSEFWQDKKARSGFRRMGSREQEKPKLEDWLSSMAKEEVPKETMRALWDYSVYLSSSQGRKPKELEKIKFSDAMPVLSLIGPSIAQKFYKEWKELRKKAKAVSFGYLYGMWWKKFVIYARDNYGVTVTDKEAQESRELFFELYPDFAPWHTKQKKFARSQGYVRTLTGRMRRLPAASGSRDDMAAQEAQRQAINSPVQSFASDLNLMAALEMDEEFDYKDFRILGTVHDSILMLIKEDKLIKTIKRVKEIMSHPKLMDELGIRLSVPIEAEVTIGAWGAGKGEKDYFKDKANVVK
jgi:hypothetical protein